MLTTCTQVKSIVELFTKQTELMPLDETAAQHALRQAEEIKSMEEDKKSAAGLFKGAFTKDRRPRLWRDEADGGILRCPNCGHEHEGGPSCAHCGEQFANEGDDFSDIDDEDLDLEAEDLDHIEIDLDAESEVDAEFAALHDHHHFLDMPAYPHHGAAGRHAGHRHRFQDPAILDLVTDGSTSDEVFHESEDETSLDGFIARDDEEESEPYRPGRARARGADSQRVTIDLTSDDESDEGGAISDGRSRRRLQAGRSPPPPAVPDALTISDDSSVHGSDYDETRSEAELRLQSAGWSPLDNDNDSEVEHPVRYGYEYAEYTDYGASEDEDDHRDDGSDTTNTSTIDGNPAHYHTENGMEDEHELSDSSFSQTPTGHDDSYARRGSPYYGTYAGRYHSLSGGEDDEDEEVVSGVGAGIDQEGDTEMSVSSRSSRSHSESFTEDGRARDVSEQLTDYGADRVTDDESVYGYDGDSHRYHYQPNSPAEFTDYDADRATDEESVQAYAGGDHSTYLSPTFPQDTSTSPRTQNTWRPLPPLSPNFPPFSHTSPRFEPRSPSYAPASPGAVGEQPTYDDPDAEDSDDSGYRIHTYVANAVHEPEEESSDGSIRAPARRQPRQPRQYSVPGREAVQVHNHNPFDPIFVESRERVNGSRTNPINIDGAGDDWEGEIRRVMEPSSRSRRMTAYRNMPARRIDPLRSSRSSSVNRITSSSSRSSRYPRQYQRRG